MHKVISVIAIILALLFLGTAQFPPGSEFSCIGDSSFEGTLPSWTANIISHYLFIWGCGTNHIYSFTTEKDEVYAIGREYIIKFTPGSIPDLCSQGDGIMIAKIVESITKFKIVYDAEVSWIEMRDFKNKLIITLVFTPERGNSMISPKKWDGTYRFQFPTVKISFSSSGTTTIGGCDQTSAVYSISNNGIFSFKDSTCPSDCDIYTRFIAQQIETFTELSFTDKNSCGLLFSLDRKYNYYQLSAKKINSHIKPIPIEAGSSLVGRYVLQQIQTQILITEDTDLVLKLSFQGCNPWNLTYIKSNAKEVSFRQSETDNTICTVNRDREIMSVLESINQIERNPANGRLSLSRNDGQVMVAIVKPLAGTYSVNLLYYPHIQPNIMTLTQEDHSKLRLTLYGCNEYQIFYRIVQKQSSYLYRIFYLDLQSLRNTECKPDYQLFVSQMLKSAATVGFNINTRQLQFANRYGDLSFSGKQYIQPVPVRDSASLVGKYWFKDQDQVYFTITEDNNEFIHLQMFGCYRMNFTYSKESNGRFSLYRRGGMRKMRKLCEIDHDDKYVQMLTSLVSINHDNQKFRLMKDDGEAIEFQKKLLVGIYQLRPLNLCKQQSFPTFKVTITEDTAQEIKMTIELCNMHYFHFMKMQDISIFQNHLSFYNYSFSTGNKCEHSDDQTIVERLMLIDIAHYNATSRNLQLRSLEQGILFEGQEYHEPTPTSAENSVAGRYFSAANDLEFTITDDNNKFIKMRTLGCNPIDFIYSRSGPGLLSLANYITHPIQASGKCNIERSNEYIKLFEAVFTASLSPDRQELLLERKDGGVIKSKRKTLFEYYELIPSNPDVKSMKVRLQTYSQEQMVFITEGCNSFRHILRKTERVSLQEEGVIHSNSFSHLRNNCDSKNDQVYLDGFLSVRMFEYDPVNANIILRNSEMAVVFRGKRFNAPAQRPLSLSHVGRYSLALSSGTLNFSIIEDNEEFMEIKFKICREVVLTYKRKGHIYFTYTESMWSVRIYRQCDSSLDQQTYPILKNIVLINSVPERQELRLVTSGGGIYFAKKESNTKYLLGNHSLYMIDEDYPLKVSITNETFSFWGCNKVTYRYNVIGGNRIEFEYLNQTNRQCLANNDYKYDLKLEKIVKIELNQITGDLRLLNANFEAVYSTIESDFSSRKYTPS